jgi:hypothetical protein
MTQSVLGYAPAAIPKKLKPSEVTKIKMRVEGKYISGKKDTYRFACRKVLKYFEPAQPDEQDEIIRRAKASVKKRRQRVRQRCAVK